MLILEIALGVVLAVLILRFLPELIALGGVALLVAIAIGVIGAIWYLLSKNPDIFWLLIIVSVALFIYRDFRLKGRNAEEANRHRRNELGYDSVDDSE